MMPGVTRTESLGDRLEQAIERHTDTAGEIERGEAAEPPRSHVRRTVIWLAITGVSLYLVFPSVIQTFGSWREITKFSLFALVGMAALQAASQFCLWVLQRVALRTPRWRPVIASQL